MVLSGLTYVNGASTSSHACQRFVFNSDYVATYSVGSLPDDYSFLYWTYSCSEDLEDKIDIAIEDTIVIIAKAGYRLANTGSGTEEVVTGTFTGNLFLHSSGGGGGGDPTPIANLVVTLVADPAGYGTVTGGGTFNYGDTCTVKATVVNDSTCYTEFVSWSDGGAQTHSFAVTSDVTLTATFKRYRMINFFLEDWAQDSSMVTWRSVISKNGESLDIGIGSDGEKHLGRRMYLDVGESCQLSTDPSANAPSWLTNQFQGFYQDDERQSGGTLISSSTSFTFTPQKKLTLIFDSYKIRERVDVSVVKSNAYKDAADEAITDSTVREAVKPTVALTDSSRTDIELSSLSWDSSESRWYFYVTFCCLDTFLNFKITAPVVKESDTDLTYGPMSITSDDFDVLDDSGYEETWPYGGFIPSLLNIYVDYLNAFECARSTSQSDPGVVVCKYSMPPYCTFKVICNSATDLEWIANWSNLLGFKAGTLRRHDQFLVSTGKYQVKFPISGVSPISSSVAITCETYSTLATSGYRYAAIKLMKASGDVLVASGYIVGGGTHITGSVASFPDEDFTVLFYIAVGTLLYGASGALIYSSAGELMYDG